jgi:FMN phosphatase YigB (HAD superfamily)
MNNIILTDVDGVLLNWEFAFDVWMQEHGHQKQQGNETKYNIGKRYGIDGSVGNKLIKTFNESAAIGFLPPLRDAMYYVRKLHEEHGYVFRCITSLSLDKNAQKLRRMNLEKLFGETVFDDIICLDTGADKDEALEQYKGSGWWWIEDKIVNAQVGEKMGLKPIIVEHGHNMDYAGPIPLVKNWAEIYELITDHKV